MKIFWIILGVLVAIVLLAAGGIYWWWASNEQELMLRMEQASQQAQQVAAAGDSNDCVSAMKKRVAECDDLLCQVVDRIFIEQCLEQASVAEHFCKDVPQDGEIMAVANWSVKQCDDVKKGINACIQAMDAVPKFCSTQ